MAYENPKTKRAKTMGFGKQAFIAKTYGGRTSEAEERRFRAAPYGMRRTDENNE